MTNEVLEVIRRRRSIRVFKDQQLKDEEIQTILEGGMWAPSGGNTQPWYFTVVQNQELLAELNVAAKQNALRVFPQAQQMLSNENFQVFHNAPTVIFVSGSANPAQAGFDSTDPKIIVMDTSAAVQNMLLTAESLGIGSVWMVMPVLAFTGDAGRVFTKRLAIPEGYEIMHAVSLGYKKGPHPEAPERRKNVVNFIK